MLDASSRIRLASSLQDGTSGYTYPKYIEPALTEIEQMRIEHAGAYVLQDYQQTQPIYQTIAAE